MFTNVKSAVVTVARFIANMVSTGYKAYMKVLNTASAPRAEKFKIHTYLPYILLAIWLIKPAMITAVVTFVGHCAGAFVFLLLLTYVFSTLINDLFRSHEAQVV